MDANTKSMSVPDTKRWVSSNTFEIAAIDSDSLMVLPCIVFSIHCPGYEGILGNSHFPVSFLF